MTEAITWTNEKRKLGELIPWPRNPRLIYEAEGQRLVKSYKEFAQAELILLEPGNGLLNGHQRLKVWATEFGPELEVEVRVASRKLTEKEKEKLTIYLHKGTTGQFDWDTLSSWDVPDLLDWGFKESELGLIGDLPKLDDLKEKYGEPGERDFWPVVKVQVSPETMEKYKAVMATLPGADEAEKFDALVSGDLAS